MLEYWKEMVFPEARGFPSLTRQSSYPTLRKTLGFIKRAELNHPQWRRIFAMSQSLAHMFIIWTVYEGIPVGRGGTSPWYITMSSFEHTIPRWFKPQSSAMQQNFSAVILFHYHNMYVKGSRTSRLQQLPRGD